LREEKRFTIDDFFLSSRIFDYRTSINSDVYVCIDAFHISSWLVYSPFFSFSSLIMVAIDRVGHVYPSVHLQDMLKLAQKPAPLATPTQYTSTVLNDPVASVMNGGATQKISPSQFGLANNPSLQFATPGGGFVQVFGPLKTPGNDKFFHDPNPVVIQKRSKPITYVQKINLAYYKPPAPPAPGPVIIKEVRF
jgi:hypothetical protein